MGTDMNLLFFYKKYFLKNKKKVQVLFSLFFKMIKVTENQ